MEELKIDYRIIYCPDDTESFYSEKATDAIIINCDKIIACGDPNPEQLEEFLPNVDLVIREGDERWERIIDIKEHGERTH